MRRKWEGVGDGGGWKKIRWTRIKPPLAVCVEMNGGRKKQVNPFADPSRDLCLKVVGIFLGKVVVALDTCVRG